MGTIDAVRVRRPVMPDLQVATWTPTQHRVGKVVREQLQEIQDSRVVAEVAMDELASLHLKAGSEALTMASFYDLLRTKFPEGLPSHDAEFLNQLWRLYKSHLFVLTEASNMAICNQVNHR